MNKKAMTGKKPILAGMLAAVTLLLVVQVGLSFVENDDGLADAPSEETQEERSIAELRHESISNGKIFDDYRIPYEMSPALVELFDRVETIKWNYTRMNERLEAIKDYPYPVKTNSLDIRLTNFVVLTDAVVNPEKVAALVIHEGKLAGTYQQPDLEPLQKLHAYLEAEYPVGAVSESLEDMFGSMSVLAPEILEIVETQTLLGDPPYEMYEADLYYWGVVREYGECILIEGGDDCDRYLEEAQARAWEQ